MPSNLKPPENLDFSSPMSWTEWSMRFTRYRTATKLNEETGAIQVSTLIYAMGPQAEKLFQSFNLPVADQTDYNKVLDAFKGHFIPKRNVIHERAIFHSRSQKEGENFEAFIRSLYDLSQYAEFDNRDETIRDRIVLGVRDRELSEKLQMTADLTLTKATEIARQYEQVKTHLALQRERGDDLTQGATSVDTVKKPCGQCGYDFHRYGKCPALNKTCSKCSKRNHFAKVCRSKTLDKKVSELHYYQPDLGATHHNFMQTDARPTLSYIQSSANQTLNPSYQSENRNGPPSHFLGSVEKPDNESEPPWKVYVMINAKYTQFKIDTGADVSVISKATYDKLGVNKPKLQPVNTTLTSPGGNVNCRGQFVAKAGRNDTNLMLRLFVVDGVTENLLSRDAAVRFGLVKGIENVRDLAFGKVGEPVKCEPIKITLREDAEPYSISAPRRIPIPLLPKVEQELKRMEACGVIEKITEPTDWCSPMVPVLKPSGDIRICVDLKKLNSSVKRERYTLPALEDLTHKFEGKTKFSKLDATSGFWQLSLDEETAKLTTFMTPFGRYYFKRLPFGINLAPEIFQRTMESILEGCEGCVCYMDDVIISGDTPEEHDTNLDNALKKIAEAGLKLNKSKCEFGKSKIDFVGHTISERGLEPNKEKIKAIVEMEAPKDVPELRRFLGMVGFLGRFIPSLSTVLHPLNTLLHKDFAWTWDTAQKNAFTEVKRLVTNSNCLAFFKPTRKTIVCSDSSAYGIGGVIYQEIDNELKPIAFCSRSLTSAEKKYAQIEKECLGIVFACEKFERFLVGLPEFRFITDHRPLVPMINKKDLNETPVRCQRMLMRLLRYNIQAEFAPGKSLVVADTLSRAPIETSDSTPDNLESDVKVHLDAVRLAWDISDSKLEDFRKATANDIQLDKVLNYIRLGWPDFKSDCHLSTRQYFSLKDELSEVDGLVTRGGRIVIPISQRDYVLTRIHQGHLGIAKSRERANQAVWWPGMSTQIKDLIGQCRFCEERRNSQVKEPMTQSDTPDYPFQKVGVDLFDYKSRQYLILVDYFSRWIDFTELTNDSTSETVINAMKKMFASHGIPEVVVSDNGPQFSSSEFHHFSNTWNFIHKTSSPKHPQSNGEAERAVQQAKQFLKQPDPQLGLLSYRATPIPSLGASPSQLASGRRLRTTLPALPKTFVPQPIDMTAFQRKDEEVRATQKHYYDIRHGVKPLPILRPGNFVRIEQNGKEKWSEPCTVQRQYSPKSYVIQTPSGRHFRRNRQQLLESSFQPRQRLETFPWPEQSKTFPVADHMPQNPMPLQPCALPPESNEQLNTQSQNEAQTPPAVVTRSGRVSRPPEKYKDYE